ncbi:copper homeostasis membrane protein CopD [Achromobacter aloeverae]|uniref:Cu resistance protein n=1 Tax=Achromobacter aloeverae TaxID=1750518 RepID=A0A4V1MSI7_9BURK|nr:copper homeostasis membrane protein CopD [Achromobacter aloeverae]RXN91719.1 Cu resistance protein [Achromobacter aloeverae]
MTPLFAAFAASRFLAYASGLLLFGASAMLALAGHASLARSARVRLRGLLIGAAVVGVLSVLLLLPLQTASIADDPRAMLDPSMLGTVAWRTRYGQAWLLRMAGVAALLAVVWAGARRHGARGGWQALVAALALAPLCLGGHAAMQEGGAGIVHALADFIHCLAAGFWLGALPVFLHCLRAWEQPDLRPQAGRALMRFSTAGHIAVALLLASGAVNAWMIVAPAGLDADAGYQQLLLLKILLALAMALLAVVNRYRWLRRLRVAREQALARIRGNTIAELVLGALALAVVGCLGLMAPGPMS